ncbi:MAG: N-6 DNA methylase, partial [Bifidobacteriaceae bacterium]|nr:N-6 DNA methylase [Bifidobacteriaceae bacterium]
MSELVGACRALGAAKVAGLTDAEAALMREARPPAIDFEALAARIAAGEDPLGDAFCEIRQASERRSRGQTFTPAPIVRAMLAWSRSHQPPARVVDPGVGSGRYLLAAAAAYPDAALVGADTDPMGALMARANLAAIGAADRASVELADYRALSLPVALGPTLFIGNPPYVRHHGIEPAWKLWLTEAAAAHGYPASQLAGLHVHFFLATLGHARPGDFGAFVTASEWLDVNYGALVREMLTNALGGESIHVIAPEAMPFADAA